MNKEISQKVMENAVKKAPKKSEDILIYVLLNNKKTGEIKVKKIDT